MPKLNLNHILEYRIGLIIDLKNNIILYNHTNFQLDKNQIEFENVFLYHIVLFIL